MSEQAGKAFIEEITEITGEVKQCNKQIDTLEENMKSLNQVIKMERQLRQGQTGIFYRPLLLERNYLESEKSDDEGKEKSLLSDIASFGATGAGLGFTLSGDLIAMAGIGGAIGVGVAGLIYAIDQIVDDAIETAENVNNTFQSTLQSRLRSAYEDQARGIAEGVSLAAAQEWDTAFTKGYSTDQTYLGLESRVQAQKENTLAAGGKGYIETRTRGLQKEELFYEGEGGEQLALANDLIGRFYASQDNLETQYQLDAKTMVMSGKSSEVFSSEANERFEEMNGQYETTMQKREQLQYAMLYAQDMGNMKLYEQKLAEYDRLGSEAGAILIRAECLAKAEYAASEGAQLELQTQTALIDAVAADTALQEKYYNTGMILGDHMGQGLAKAIARNHPFDPPSDYLLGNSTGTPSKQPASGKPSYDGVSYGTLPGAAYGIPYVPRDNYVMRLHEGERVLTAQEARGYGKGAGSGVTVHVHGLTVREEADVDRIATQFYKKIRLAQMIS